MYRQQRYIFNNLQILTYFTGMPSTRFLETSSGARAVDDIIVPAGSTWSVRKIQLMGSWFSGSQRTTELPLFAPNITFAVTIFHQGTIQCKTNVVMPLPLPQVLVLNIAASRCLLVGAHETLDGSMIMSDERFYLTVAPYLDVNSQVIRRRRMKYFKHFFLKFKFSTNALFSFIGLSARPNLVELLNGEMSKISLDFQSVVNGPMETNAAFQPTGLICASEF